MTQLRTIDLIVVILIIMVIDYMIFMHEDPEITNSQIFVGFTVNSVLMIAIMYRMAYGTLDMNFKVSNKSEEDL